ncbi:hypothetical protein ACP4OV_026920 [Aristida adscensionis]
MTATATATAEVGGAKDAGEVAPPQPEQAGRAPGRSSAAAARTASASSSAGPRGASLRFLLLRVSAGESKSFLGLLAAADRHNGVVVGFLGRAAAVFGMLNYRRVRIGPVAALTNYLADHRLRWAREPAAILRRVPEHVRRRQLGDASLSLQPAAAGGALILPHLRGRPGAGLEHAAGGDHRAQPAARRRAGSRAEARRGGGAREKAEEEERAPPEELARANAELGAADEELLQRLAATAMSAMSWEPRGGLEGTSPRVACMPTRRPWSSGRASMYISLCAACFRQRSLMCPA